MDARRRDRKHLPVGALSLLLCWVVLGSSMPGFPIENLTVSGTVRDMEGKTLFGVIVTARNMEKGISHSFVSGADGRYLISSLLPGAYEVRAEKQEYAELRKKLQLAASAEEDFSLQHVGKNVAQMNLSDWMQVLPEGEGRELVSANCQGCHDLGLTVMARKDRAEWKETIYDMYLRRGGGKPTPAIADTMADYLARHFSSGAPPFDRIVMQAPPLNPEAAHTRIVQYEIPTPESWAHDGALDYRGNFWYGGYNSNRIGRLNIATGDVQEWMSPTEKSGIHGMVVDRSTGLVWFTEQAVHASAIGVFDPKTERFEEYPTPTPQSGPHTFAWDADGNLWFTAPGANHVAKIDLRTKEITEYKIPTPNAGAYGVVVDKQRNLVYFTEIAKHKIGRLNPRTGEIEEISTPTPTAAPRRMDIDAEGNVWFAEFNVSKLGKLIVNTDTIEEYDLPTPNSGPYAVLVDPEGYVWVCEFYTDRIAKFDPRTRRFVEYPLPGQGARVRVLDMDREGNLWFSEFGTDKITMLQEPPRRE